MEDSLSSLLLAEDGDIRDRGQWRQVPSQHSKCISSVTTPPYQVPLHNRYEALQVELNDNEDNSSSSIEVLLRLSQPMPRIKTASIKKSKQVVVIGDSLMKGTEGPICRADPLLREVCCLPGLRFKA